MSPADRKRSDRKVLLRGEDSNGALAMIEHRVPAGSEGSPLDQAFDEAFYVLEGELVLQLGDRFVRAPAGRLAFAPRGMPHAVSNPGDAQARYLVMRTPGDATDVSGAGSPSAARTDPGDAELLPAVPGRVKVLLRGADSGGRIAVMDNVVSAGGKGPPLHHHDFDEAFYVLEGEGTFQLAGRLVTRGPGELVFAPRGAQHTFANLSGAEVRWLLICTPAGFERYFQRIAAREAGVEPPPEALEPWPEVTVVGPPIGYDEPPTSPAS